MGANVANPQQPPDSATDAGGRWLSDVAGQHLVILVPVC